MVDDALFSSTKKNWGTPQELFDSLNAEFNFDLDAAASPENTKCQRYLTKKDDALSCDWPGKTIFLNPPYGRKESKIWVKKAWEESRKGKTVVCLLPSRTDTSWFHDFVYNKAETRFLRGRLKFEGAKDGAPFPSMVVIFRGELK